MKPTAWLLAHCLLDLKGEFDRLGSHEDPEPSLLVWSDMLRPIPSDGIPATDLPGAARVSRRAVRSWLGRLERSGLLEVAPDHRGIKAVRLTATGEETKRRCGELAVAAERAWRGRVGEDRVAALRGALDALVAQFDLELPHYPMVYGTADPGALGGRAVAASGNVPAHGSDWVPVLRSSDGDLRELPLSALLSQALMAATIDYEQRSGLALAVVGLLARSIPEGAVPASDLPPVLGVTGSGRTGLERHGIVRVNNDRAELTPAGTRIRDGHEANLDAVDANWRERYGATAVDSLLAALASADEVVGADLPDYVIIRHGATSGFRDVSLDEATRPPQH